MGQTTPDPIGVSVDITAIPEYEPGIGPMSTDQVAAVGDDAVAVAVAEPSAAAPTTEVTTDDAGWSDGVTIPEFEAGLASSLDAIDAYVSGESWLAPY